MEGHGQELLQVLKARCGRSSCVAGVVLGGGKIVTLGSVMQNGKYDVHGNIE